VEYKITAEEYGLTKDVHTLLLLYSLAKDAQQRGLRKDLIINYLSYAYGIASDCKFKDSPDVETIRNAVSEMLRELGASSPAAIVCPRVPGRSNQ
jgi:hypothetical protein